MISAAFPRNCQVTARTMPGFLGVKLGEACEKRVERRADDRVEAEHAQRQRRGHRPVESALHWLSLSFGRFNKRRGGRRGRLVAHPLPVLLSRRRKPYPSSSPPPPGRCRRRRLLARQLADFAFAN